MRSMRPPVDLGPARVRGHRDLTATGRARVMWDEGVLYVARSSRDVVRVDCPEQPPEPTRVGQDWSAQTAVGTITFRRKGCSCSYSLGNVAFGTLVGLAVDVGGVESTPTPGDTAPRELTEADTP